MDGGSDVDHIHSLWPEDSQTISVKRLQFLLQRMDSVTVIWCSYIFIKNQPKRHFPRGPADAETEALILWPPDAKSWLTGKDPDAGEDWRQEEKGATEGEMVGWHHPLNEHEFG